MYQNLTEKGKEKKLQYHFVGNKIFSEEEKEKNQLSIEEVII